MAMLVITRCYMKIWRNRRPMQTRTSWKEFERCFKTRRSSRSVLDTLFHYGMHMNLIKLGTPPDSGSGFNPTKHIYRQFFGCVYHWHQNHGFIISYYDNHMHGNTMKHQPYLIIFTWFSLLVGDRTKYRIIYGYLWTCKIGNYFTKSQRCVFHDSIEGTQITLTRHRRRWLVDLHFQELPSGYLT